MRSVAWGPALDQRCPDCAGTRQMVTGEVLDDEGASTVAVFLAFLYDHGDGREAYVHLVLGPWGEDADAGHRLTFSTRTGPVDGGSIASTLLDGGFASPDDPMLGTKVSREEGLVHPALPTVWSCLDAVLVDVPEVGRHLTAAARPRRRGWRLRRR